MQRNNAVFVDWLNLTLAVLLFISPWVFGFSAAAAGNAWILGIIIGGLAIAALAAYAQWEEWVNLVAGVWVIIAPFVVGFAGDAAATWTHIVIGAAVAVLAAIELWMLSGIQQPQQAVR